MTDKTVDYHESVQLLMVGKLMKSDIQQEAWKHLAWVRLYEETHDAGVVCNRCDISRPTLRLWLKRYQQSADAGLQGLSRHPHRSPAVKVTPECEQEKGSTNYLFNADVCGDGVRKIFIVEGRLDALALTSLGYSTVANPMWNVDWNKYLNAQCVIIIADRDANGVGELKANDELLAIPHA